MSELMKRWKDAENNLKAFDSWQNLPKTKGRSERDSFGLNKAHCKPPVLCREGQHTTGGKNYWETEKATNQVILEYLVDNWDTIAPFIRSRLQEKETYALIKCQSFIDEMQTQITQAKEGKTNDPES